MATGCRLQADVVLQFQCCFHFSSDDAVADDTWLLEGARRSEHKCGLGIRCPARSGSIYAGTRRSAPHIFLHLHSVLTQQSARAPSRPRSRHDSAPSIAPTKIEPTAHDQVLQEVLYRHCTPQNPPTCGRHVARVFLYFRKCECVRVRVHLAPLPPPRRPKRGCAELQRGDGRRTSIPIPTLGCMRGRNFFFLRARKQFREEAPHPLGRTGRGRPGRSLARGPAANNGRLCRICRGCGGHERR
mmetsp:Transcript_14341/g.35732  ORF Transcript_14341/g.35732 Transcript_14341/m.35732 type:complete len:243 (+) Transcript_14341:1358-2086(+)